MSAPRVPLEFDEFILDVARYSLRRCETTIVLQPKTFALLAYFCANPGRLIRKDELLRELWPDVIVTDNSLTRCVKDLRKALGDDVQVPRFIETVPRMGYRFLAEPRPLASVAPAPLAVESDRVAQADVHDEAAAQRRPAQRSATRSVAILALVGIVVVLALAVWQGARDRAGQPLSVEPAPDASGPGIGKTAASSGFDAEMNFRLGRDLLERRRHGWREQAMAAFERALEIEPDHAGAHAGKALAHAVSARPGERREAELAAADAAAARALELDPDSGLAQAAQGLVLLQRGEHADAEATLRRAVALEPQFVAARSWLIIALQSQGRHEESLVHLERALALDPINPRLLDGYGVALERRGDLDGAQRMYERMLRLQDPPPGARIRLTSLALGRGRLADAMVHADALQDFAEPLHPAASLITPALIYARMGACAEARSRIRAARSETLRDTWLGQLELAHRALGWFGQLEGLVGPAAQSVDSRLFLGRAAVLSGDDALGIERLETAFSTSPPLDPADASLTDSMLALAFALQQGPRVADARAHLDRVLAKQAARVAAGVSGRPDAQYLDAMTLHLAGRDEDAVAALERAVALGWNDVYTAWYDRRWQGLWQHDGFRRSIESGCARVAAERRKLAISTPIAESASACPPREHRATCTP